MVQLGMHDGILMLPNDSKSQMQSKVVFDSLLHFSSKIMVLLFYNIVLIRYCTHGTKQVCFIQPRSWAAIKNQKNSFFVIYIWSLIYANQFRLSDNYSTFSIINRWFAKNSLVEGF